MRYRRPRVAAGLFFAANGVAFSTWAASIPRVAEALHLSAGQVAAVTFTLSLGSMLTMPAVGRLADRFGAHRVSIAAGLAVPLILPFFVEAPSLPILLVFGFLFGSLLGAFDVAINAYAVAAETAEDGAWMSQMHGIWSVGNVAGSVAITALVAAGTAKPSILGACVIVVAILVAARIAVPIAHLASPVPKSSQTAILVLFGVLAAFGLLVEGAMGDWAALYLRRDEGASAVLAPAGYAVFAGAMMATRFVGDAIVLRAGRARTLTVSAAITAGGLAVALVTHGAFAASAAFVFVGIGCANLAPTVFGAAGRIAAGRGVALVITIGLSAFLVGPALIGGVAQFSDLRHALWIVVAAALAIAIATSTQVFKRALALR